MHLCPWLSGISVVPFSRWLLISCFKAIAVVLEKYGYPSAALCHPPLCHPRKSKPITDVQLKNSMLFSILPGPPHVLRPGSCVNGRFRIGGSKALLPQMAHGGSNGGLCFQSQGDLGIAFERRRHGSCPLAHDVHVSLSV